MAHMHYKGTGKVHSFRGLLADGDQRRIRIQGSVGAIAWRITKFQLMGEKPAGANQESIVKIWREEQTSPDQNINFDNDELLAAGYLEAAADAKTESQPQIIIFDNTLFVRNIWISYVDSEAGESCNYYIELEEVKVSAAGMAQLAVAAARRTID